MTCLISETEYGISIIESTSEAEKMPKPDGVTCNLVSRTLTRGTMVYRPQKPYTTDGMAANRSIIFLKMFGIIHLGKYSPRKSAAAIENGAEINKARKDVIRVPIKNGNIP